jgi:hypothetical protein
LEVVSEAYRPSIRGARTRDSVERSDGNKIRRVMAVSRFVFTVVLWMRG